MRIYLSGARSQDRDLESQIILLTENENLRHQLHQEQQKMYRYSKPFNRTTLAEEGRSPKSWISLLVFLLKSYFWIIFLWLADEIIGVQIDILSSLNNDWILEYYGWSDRIKVVVGLDHFNFYKCLVMLSVNLLNYFSFCF